MERRTYSKADKAAALAALATNGGNVEATANALGIPSRTLQNWKDKAQRVPDFVDEGDKKASIGELGKLFSDMALRLVGLVKGKEHEATYAQLMTGLGITIDKLPMIRQLFPEHKGEPTKDILDQLTPEQLVTLNGWLEANKARQQGDGTTVGAELPSELHPSDVPNVPMELASSDPVSIPGRDGIGEHQAVDGVHATETREE